MHVPLMFLSEWREFPLAPCLAKKNLITARVSMLSKLRASPDMLPFSLCSKKRLAIRHMNRSLFPTTLSIPSYDIGKWVGLRTYQHPLVHVSNVFSCYAGEAWRRSSWTDRVKNEVLHRDRKKRNIVRTIKRRKVNWIFSYLV